MLKAALLIGEPGGLNEVAAVVFALDIRIEPPVARAFIVILFIVASGAVWVLY